MELNRELYDRIQETAAPKLFEVDGRTYSNERLNLIEPPEYRPAKFTVNTLKSLADIIKAEIYMDEESPKNTIKELPLIVNVESPNIVSVYTTYDDKFRRALVYSAENSKVNLDSVRGYIPHEQFMIELRSKFVRNDDVAYLLKLLASVVDENKVSSTDNGLSQKVAVQQGISIIGEEPVKPIVSLAPYRTFIEVEQPESEFLVRLKEGGGIALFEADGGAWKLAAKRNVADFLRNELSNLIEDMKVIVTE